MSEFKTCDQWVEHLDENTGHLIDESTYELIASTWSHAESAATKDLRQQLGRAEARVAELESREAAMCDLSYANGTKQGYIWGQLDDNDALAKCVESRIPAGVAELKRLRQQAGQEGE